MAKNFNELTSGFSKKRLGKIKKRTKQILEEVNTLQELRKIRDLSQGEIAKTLHVNQAAVSKIERRADIYISSLRSYIEALGGSLEIIAKFPRSEPIKISHFDNL